MKRETRQTARRMSTMSELRSSAEERAFWRAFPDSHGQPFPSLIAAMDDIDTLERELAEMREALEREWNVNHAAHCGPTAHTHPCWWPQPKALAGPGA